MKKYCIKQGRNIPLGPEPAKELRDVLSPTNVCIQPTDFKGLKPRLLVAVGDKIKSGELLFSDRHDNAIRVVASMSGEVVSIARGYRRVLKEIVIQCEETQVHEAFRVFDDMTLVQQTSESLIEHLCLTGLWPLIRQRPFSRIASTRRDPKAIYIQGFSSEPMAADSDFILEGQEDAFKFGLKVIAKLSVAPIHLCISSTTQSKALLEAAGVHIHQFIGPHPAGNVSTHISRIDPINKGDVVWTINFQDVIRIGRTFKEGRYCAERMISTDKDYVKTVIGAPLSELLDGDLSKKKCISGGVLTGKDVGAEGYLCFYDSQVTVISDDVERKLFGWMVPGNKLFSLTRAFLSAFVGNKKVVFDADTHGSSRPMVAQDMYNYLTPLDIHVNFLVKAILSGDLDEACALGLLECDPEDFALCSFACPSKLNIGEVIAEGLAELEKEIY